jgi:hypothetical protein
MPTIATVDATWDTGTTMDAAELRRADSAMFLGDGTANGVRGGIVRHGDTSLAVAVNGSDQITVQPGAFVVPAATGLGAYRGSLQTATAATGVAARNGTNPRIDLVVIQVGTGSVATVKTIDGTPSSSPTAPALPAQHIELARLTVPQVGGGAITVDSTWRTYASGLGGTLYVETAARLPGSGNQKGQRAVALDTGLTHAWDGTAWISSAAAWTAYTPAVAGFTTQAGAWFRWKLDGSTVKVQASTKIATVGATFVVPVPASMGPYMGGLTEDRVVGTWHALDVGTARFSGAVIASATDFRFAIDGVPQLVGTTTPFTWAAGDPFSFEATFEKA